MKWNVSYVILVVFQRNLPKMNPLPPPKKKQKKNGEMSFESHIGHVLFKGAALKNPAFCSIVYGVGFS